MPDTDLPSAGQAEDIFHQALRSGNAARVVAALQILAVRDPHRAQELHDALRAGLASARDTIHTVPDQPAVPDPVVTQYSICVLPHTNRNYPFFVITVDRALGWRGEPRWAVRRLGRCLNRLGVWEWEPQPSSRTDEWLAGHRFDRAQALKLAATAAPTLTSNGVTVAEALADGNYQ